MKTTDLFKINRSSRRLNESMERIFGKKINLESFDLPKLEDARNKLRTQLSQIRTESSFNENLENEAYSQAQFMLDAINAEIAQREEFVVDTTTEITTMENKTMTKLREGEIQQAQSIVSAKTMVDRVGRWIEELSGMENDTLLQLGDQVRDEMSAELAKQYISSVAPAIQQALENLKTTRETLASGVRMLTGEEQGAEMLGAEPGASELGDLGDLGGMGGEEELGAVEPDSMNLGGEMGAPEDEFGASDAAAGGLGDAGRAKRESIEYGNKLLKVLAG